LAPHIPTPSDARPISRFLLFRPKASIVAHPTINVHQPLER
jgi:hypothetical protein